MACKMQNCGAASEVLAVGAVELLVAGALALAPLTLLVGVVALIVLRRKRK